MIRGLIGVVHLPAMPGDPSPRAQSFTQVHAHALRDAIALAKGGVDALIIENYGSVPFVKGTSAERLPAHQVATLALVAQAVRAATSLPTGVNCLRNDALSAMGIAAAVGLDFIRVNVHCGAYLTDQGVIEGEAHRTLRERQALNATHVQILADVLVKHAHPLVPLTPEEATRDTLERGLADGIIVTGPATGAPVDRAVLERVAQAAQHAPVYLGSGVNLENAVAFAQLCDGAIVGTHFKVNGRITAPVDLARVRRLVKILHGHWRGPTHRKPARMQNNRR